MDLNSIIFELEEDKIAFQDKLSLAFMVIGGIFFIIIVLSLVLSLLSFDQMEFEMPFF